MFFDQLMPLHSDVLYQRGDKNDLRLGEVVLTDPQQYAAAQVVLIGCPQDEGVRRNKGRVGAAQAPEAIRRALYRLVAPENEIALFDAGDTRIQPTLEETHTLHSRIVRQMLEDGKRVVALGGGNDLSYADCAALAAVADTVLAINVDAHFDVRADTIRNSGTPYRQLLEEGRILPQNFYEVGSLPMANSAVYRNYLVRKGAHIIDLNALYQQGISTTFERILENRSQAIFWGLDMDVVRAADAPGVSAPNPIGISGYEFCQIGAVAGQDRRTRVFEITEVNPTYDLDSRTARLAAAAVYHFISSLKDEENDKKND